MRIHKNVYILIQVLARLACCYGMPTIRSHLHSSPQLVSTSRLRTFKSMAKELNSRFFKKNILNLRCQHLSFQHVIINNFNANIRISMNISDLGYRWSRAL